MWIQKMQIIVERMKTSLACEEIACVMQKVAISSPEE